ncbi:MAG: hypothetical protein NC419_10360 [Muribaculaceae bacterium]|nr:hypothetical protein [Muribaculaceae bacterium]
MNTIDNRKISHKVGIKLLSDLQLENILPTYENLFQKFETCRKVAQTEIDYWSQNLGVRDRRNNYQYNFIYDNIFSILGDRGTGKTSVAFTLREKIQNHKNSRYDVVLPLIIPEAIPDNCTVLGWILALIKEEIEKLEQKIKDLQTDANSALHWDKCKVTEQTLTEKLEYMSQLFHAGSYNPSNEASYYKAVDNSVVQAEDYYHFSKEIAELWDKWVERIRQYYQLSAPAGTPGICPMIYFIFDDVDLAPEKIKQLLSVIIKYLSHPNIIVLVTANEDLCLEVIETQLDEKIGKLPKEWRGYLTSERSVRYPSWMTTEQEDTFSDKGLIEQTARKYLGKVLPTSTRYYLRTFDTAKQKELFYLDHPTFGECPLGTAFYDQIQNLIEEIGDNKVLNFMGYRKNLINFYLKYVGNTSRQISNIELSLREFISNMIEIVRLSYESQNHLDINRLINKVYQHSRYYIRIAINTNHELSDAIQQKDEFLNEIFLAEYNQWKIYIDYAFLNDFLDENMRNSSVQKKVDIGLQLYSLFAFVENIVLMMESVILSQTSSSSLIRKTIHAVPYLTEYIEKTVFDKKHVFQKSLPPFEFFLHYNDLFDRMDIIIKSRMSDMKFNTEYFYNFKYYRYYNKNFSFNRINTMYQKDRQWFRNLVGMLFMVYGNAYLFDSDNMAECLLYLDSSALPSYKKLIDRAIKNNIMECFLAPQMQIEWLEINKRNNELFHNYDTNAELKQRTQDEVNRFIAATAEQIQQEERDNNSQYIPLSGILERTLSVLGGNPEMERKIKVITFIVSNESFLDASEKGPAEYTDYEKTCDLLLEYQGKLSYADSQIGKNAILQDAEYALENLMTLKELSPIRKTYINDICRRIRAELNKQKKAGPNIVISKRLYTDLIQELNLVKSIGQNNVYTDTFDQPDETNKLITELLSNVDIGLQTDDTNAIKSGVELAVNLFALELLQTVYIYQTIDRRYAGNYNLSSRDLEKYRPGNKEQDTYYYAVFKSILDILNRKKQRPVDSGIKYEIESAYMEERQRYVSRLIAEVSDE